VEVDRVEVDGWSVELKVAGKKRREGSGGKGTLRKIQKDPNPNPKAQKILNKKIRKILNQLDLSKDKYLTLNIRYG